MNAFRYAFPLVAAVALTGAAAVAAPPISVGPPAGVPPAVAPPVNVPPVAAPPVKAPPVAVPAPQAGVRANAGAEVETGVNVPEVTTGTLRAVNGTSVTVQLPGGTAKTYAVTAQTAQQLRAMVGKPITFRVENGTLLVAGHEGNVPMHGTLTALSGSTATIRLANGTARTYTVNAQQAAWLKGHVGKSITFWSEANGTLELNQRSNAARPAPSPRH